MPKPQSGVQRVRASGYQLLAADDRRRRVSLPVRPPELRVRKIRRGISFLFKFIHISFTGIILYFRFSGIENGQLCYCSSASSGGPSGTCDVACAGDGGDVACGADGFVSVYASNLLVRGLSATSDRKYM